MESVTITSVSTCNRQNALNLHRGLFPEGGDVFALLPTEIRDHKHLSDWLEVQEQRSHILDIDSCPGCSQERTGLLSGVGALYLAVGVGGRPEADEVGPGLGEGEAGLGAAGQGVEHPALVDVLELTQVLTQLQLRGVALEEAGGDITFI